MSDPTAERILVIGPSWVGDTIMAQALYKSLAGGAGERPVIDVVAPSWSLPILARMPEVRRGIELPVYHGDLKLGLRHRIGRELRVENYDRAIVLPRSLKAALVPFFAHIPVRTGFRSEWRFGLVNDLRRLDAALDQTVKRFIALGGKAGEEPPAEIPRPALRVDPENQGRLLGTLGLRLDRPIVALLPGAEYGPAKRWPIEYVLELAQRLTGEGVDVWVLGSAKDRSFTAPLDRLPANSGLHHLCGATSLVDAVDLLALASLAVANDSGLMHMAAAVDTHVVAIYGSSSVAFTPPLTERRDILQRGLDCSPCFSRECPLGHYRCLTEISVDQVHRAVGRVLNEQAH